MLARLSCSATQAARFDLLGDDVNSRLYLQRNVSRISRLSGRRKIAQTGAGAGRERIEWRRLDGVEACMSPWAPQNDEQQLIGFSCDAATISCVHSRDRPRDRA